MREEIIKLADLWVREFWQKGELRAVDILHTENFIDHSPFGRNGNNKEFKNGIKEIYSAFPDFFAEVKDLIVDENNNKVTIRWIANGTHKGTFIKFDPTNKVIQFKGIEILKIEDNRISERWGEWDGINIIEQLMQTSIDKIINTL